MNRLPFIWIGIIQLLAIDLSLFAQEPPPKPSQFGEAAKALGGFLVKPGFRIELVAAEPMVVAPVAMAFDEDGRLFVAEMRDYPDHREENPHLGRIRLLEDTDGDGVFDTSTIYADNIPWPSAVACFGAGVFVAAAPEIIYLKDSHRDGVADIRRVVFNGFGAEASALKVDDLPNNFNWAIDNRIHGASGGTAGVVSAAKDPAASIEFGRHDFSFDPTALTILPEAGLGQSGSTFDNQGHRFISEFTRPLRVPLYNPSYLARNPFFPKAAETMDAGGSIAAIFRFSPNQGTGVARRANGLIPGWPTRVRGGVIYRGNIFPQKYLGNYFFADSAAGVVHRALLKDNGLEYSVERAPDELNNEFLVGRDPSFQPVQIVNGPDGALYIADLHEGNEKGRIFRMVPEDFQQPKTPRLGKARPYDLVANLASPNGWHSDSAARLLYEWRDPASISLLTNMFNNSRLSLARLRALHCLDGLGALNEAQIIKGLRDGDERVREHSVLLSEKLVRNGPVSDSLWNQLKSLAGDPAIRVRYQLAFTVGEIHRPERSAVLAEILRRDFRNPWFQTAVFSSLGEGAGEIFVALATDSRLRADPVGQTLLQQLLTMIGLKGSQEDAARVIDFVESSRMDQAQAFSMLYSLGEGLRRAGNAFPLVDPQNRLQPFYDQTVLATLNDALPDPLRIAAIRLRGVSPYTVRGSDDFFGLLFGTGQSEAVQSAVIWTLARYNNPGISTNLLANWTMLTPALRQEAVAALLSRSDGIPVVIAALENGRITAANLSPAQINFLRTYSGGAISQRAVQLLGPLTRQRTEVVQKYKPALRLTGTVASGRQIFLAQCATCHPFNNEGQQIGPNLNDARSFGKERNLTAILEPNRDVRSDYLTYVMVTKGGENLVGLMADENARTITLRQANGNQMVVPRTNIESVYPQTWSIMPEGFEEKLSLQGMADLLEYLAAPP